MVVLFGGLGIRILHPAGSKIWRLGCEFRTFQELAIYYALKHA